MHHISLTLYKSLPPKFGSTRYHPQVHIFHFRSHLLEGGRVFASHGASSGPPLSKGMSLRWWVVDTQHALMPFIKSVTGQHIFQTEKKETITCNAHMIHQFPLNGNGTNEQRSQYGAILMRMRSQPGMLSLNTTLYCLYFPQWTRKDIMVPQGKRNKTISLTLLFSCMPP